MKKNRDSSGSDDEDPRMAYKKALNKNSQKEKERAFNMELASKTMTKNMFQQRGLEFSEEEFKKMGSNSAANALAQKKAGGFVPGGNHASFEELKRDLSDALKKGDSKTASIVIKYILEKNIEPSERRKYAIQRCKLLIELRAYADCIAETEKQISYAQNERDIESQKFCVNLRLLLAKAKSSQDEVWSGYLELLRAQGFCQNLMLAKKEESTGDGKKKGKDWYSETDYNWTETENDLLLRELEETELHFKVKLGQEKKTASFLFCSGFSNTGCLGLGSDITQTKIALLPQMRNRQVLSVACGDHHAIALVKAFPASLLFSPNYASISPSFDHENEVFAWGENTCGQVTGDSSVIKIVEKPIVINYFSGKFINSVGAYRASSIAVDLNGAIYEWGANKFTKSESSSIEQTFNLPQKEVVTIVRGQSLYAAVDSKQQCYWWGSLKDGMKSTSSIQSAGINNVHSISAGQSHIIISDMSGKVYGIGDNSKGQLALGNKQAIVPTFTQITSLNHAKILQVKAYQDASMFVSSEGELLYVGQISHTKKSEFPKEAEFPDDAFISSCGGYDGELFALSSSGVAYSWEADSTVKFKLHKDLTGQSFRQVFAGAGFQMYTKTLPIAKLCQVKLTTEPQNLKTYESIDFEVELRDQEGQWNLKPFYPIRYQLVLSEDRSLNSTELEKLSRQFSNMTKNKYTEEKIYVDEIGGSKLFTYSVEDNQNKESSQHLLKLTVETSGVLYLYVLLNEEIVTLQPIELRIRTSEFEDQRREEQMLNEQKALENARDKALREEEKRRKQEELLEQQRLQDELDEAKRKETDDRAKEAYNKYLRDQQEKKVKDEEERKRRAELQTGGGFDLNKANLLNSQKVGRQGSLSGSQTLINQTQQSTIKPPSTNNSSNSNSNNSSQRGSLSQIPQQNVKEDKKILPSKEEKLPPSMNSTGMKKAPSGTVSGVRPATNSQPMKQVPSQSAQKPSQLGSRPVMKKK